MRNIFGIVYTPIERIYLNRLYRVVASASLCLSIQHLRLMHLILPKSNM